MLIICVDNKREIKMKKELFEFIKQLGFAFVYFVGDVIYRLVTGKNEFPRYYWIAIGIVIVYQIFKELEEIKNKLEEK